MKTLLIAGALVISTILPAHADDADLTPAAMSQIAMSEALMAIGKARDEPLMILAAVRLRATLDGPIASTGTSLTSQEDMIAAAKKAAAGDEALLGVIDDVEASSSRRMCIYARNGVCY